MALFQALFEKHEELVEIFQVVRGSATQLTLSLSLSASSSPSNRPLCHPLIHAFSPSFSPTPSSDPQHAQTSHSTCCPSFRHSHFFSLPRSHYPAWHHTLQVFLYHAVSSAAVHTICGFAAMASFYPDLGRASLGAVIVCASIPTV